MIMNSVVPLKIDLSGMTLVLGMRRRTRPLITFLWIRYHLPVPPYKAF